MKTVDLIPFILLELNAGDKYGLEITKSIETKSNGEIIIKQPTLYTILKKLEKSKFISSYWEDSEIGGKRHYYKLTEYGKLQVSTLPKYEDLIAEALQDDESDKTENLSGNVVPNDAPLETVIPSEEVFSSQDLDTLTEAEINANNSEIMNDEKTQDEVFAESISIIKFTEKDTTVTKIKTEPLRESSTDAFTTPANNKTPTEELVPEINLVKPISTNNLPIKTVDYINIKSDANYIKEKKINKNLIISAVISSSLILVLIVLCSFLTKYSGISAIFSIYLIGLTLLSIFLPVIRYIKLEKLKKKYFDPAFKFGIKKQSLISFSFILISIIIAFIFNLTIGNNSFTKIFAPSNFENLYAIILLASSTQLIPTFTWLFVKNLIEK